MTSERPARLEGRRWREGCKNKGARGAGSEGKGEGEGREGDEVIKDMIPELDHHQRT